MQVDEATDGLKDPHLITYVRYVVETDIREDMLICKPIECNTALSLKSLIFLMKMTFCRRTVLDYAQMKLHPWQKRCWLQALFRTRAVCTHCMIHRQSLVSRDLGENLLTVFINYYKSSNFIKNRQLRGRLFAKLCDAIDSESLLYYCEARLFSRAKILQRVFVLKEEFPIFLTDNNRDEANLFYDTKFFVKLKYLS